LELWDKPSTFLARLIQATVEKSSAAFCFFPWLRQFQQAFPFESFSVSFDHPEASDEKFRATMAL
jgi:hypothetical protein